jgi:hypothetical protein
MSRGRVPEPLRDPAFAVAAAKCLGARWYGGRGTEAAGVAVSWSHPEECGFCDFPVGQLIEAIDEFFTWAGLEPEHYFGETRPTRAAVEAFLTLPKEEQTRIVRKAQGYAE